MFHNGVEKDACGLLFKCHFTVIFSSEWCKEERDGQGSGGWIMSQSALEKDSINISQTALDCKGTVIILKIIKCLCWFIKWEFEANL